MRSFAFPVKLHDAYPCRGTDADGKEIVFDDLLWPGQTVGQRRGDDTYPPYGTVVERDDGLWIEAQATQGESGWEEDHRFTDEEWAEKIAKIDTTPLDDETRAELRAKANELWPRCGGSGHKLIPVNNAGNRKPDGSLSQPGEVGYVTAEGAMEVDCPGCPDCQPPAPTTTKDTPREETA